MTRRMHSGRGAGVLLLAAGVLAACESDRSTVFEPVGPPVFDFLVGTGAGNLPSGTATIAGGGGVTVSVSNLRALASGQYQFWVLGRDAQNLDVAAAGFGTMLEFFRRVDTLANGDTNFNPVTGDPIFVIDSRVVSATRTNAYAGSDDPAVTALVVALDSTADGSTANTNHAVFVTIESGPAMTPSAARFLWRRIGVGGSGAMLFGNFGGSDVINVQSSTDYVFGARGAGTGGARGTEVSVDFRELARPPVGFFYRGYVVDDDGAGVVVDTLRSAWSLDETVSRVSLFDADVNDLLPEVVGSAIRAAQVRNCASGSGVINCQNTMDLPAEDTFAGYAGVQLKIEPKGGAAPSPMKSITHRGDLPDEVK